MEHSGHCIREILQTRSGAVGAEMEERGRTGTGDKTFSKNGDKIYKEGDKTYSTDGDKNYNDGEKTYSTDGSIGFYRDGDEDYRNVGDEPSSEDRDKNLLEQGQVGKQTYTKGSQMIQGS